MSSVIPTNTTRYLTHIVIHKKTEACEALQGVEDRFVAPGTSGSNEKSMREKISNESIKKWGGAVMWLSCWKFQLNCTRDIPSWYFHDVILHSSWNQCWKTPLFAYQVAIYAVINDPSALLPCLLTIQHRNWNNVWPPMCDHRSSVWGFCCHSPPRHRVKKSFNLWTC